MARKVFSGHRVNSTLHELKAEIEVVWESLSVEYLQRLYGSTPRRLHAGICPKKRSIGSLEDW